MWACLVKRGDGAILSLLARDAGGKVIHRFMPAFGEGLKNHHSGVMDVDGYEIGEIAYLRSDGPLWAARDSQGREVLISFHSSLEGEERSDRWRQWATVDSPHVAALRDVVRHEDGRWALVQERVDGESLAILLADGGVREKAARHRIYQGICEGIAALHRAGIIHGDLSPNNIIVAPGHRAVIIDLSDDPDALAGTEGWSSRENPSMEADIDAVERIRDALLAAEGSGEVTDPATRLRLHATLPATELRAPQQRFRVASRASNSRIRSSRARNSRRSSSARRPRPRALVGVGIMVALLFGGASYAFATAHTQQAESTSSGTAEFSTAPQSAPSYKQSVSVSGPSDKEQAGVGASDRGQSSQGTRASEAAPACEGEEISRRVRDILQARDEAFNSARADELPQALGGALLEADRALIEQIRDRGINIREFDTELTALSVLSCGLGSAHVEVTLLHKAHERCQAGECVQAPEGEAQVFILELEGNPWKAVHAR